MRRRAMLTVKEDAARTLFREFIKVDSDGSGEIDLKGASACVVALGASR
jgi:hypothetical protein